MSTKNVSDEQVCKAVLEFRHKTYELQQRAPWPYEALAAETGECEKVCYRAMERAERRGLIEYGVSLRTGWLTDEGHALLKKCEAARH